MIYVMRKVAQEFKNFTDMTRNVTQATSLVKEVVEHAILVETNATEVAGPVEIKQKARQRISCKAQQYLRDSSTVGFYRYYTCRILPDILNDQCLLIKLVRREN